MQAVMAQRPGQWNLGVTDWRSPERLPRGGALGWAQKEDPGLPGGSSFQAREAEPAKALRREQVHFPGGQGSLGWWTYLRGLRLLAE